MYIHVHVQTECLEHKHLNIILEAKPQFQASPTCVLVKLKWPGTKAKRVHPIITLEPYMYM